MPPDPKKAHQVLSKQQWQQYLQAAMQAHHANPQDNEAMQAIAQANQALNAYEQEGVEQSSMSAIPGEFGAVANGAIEALKNIPMGMGQMVHHARTGDITGVAKDIGGGLAATAKGGLAPWELALRELGGEQVPSNERTGMLHDAGGALTGLEAIALPGQMSRGMKAIGGGALGGSGPEIGMTKGGLAPKAPDVSTLGEDQFMGEYRKGTMTPDQADPYGLNDRPNKSNPMFPDPASPPDHAAMSHDILSADQWDKGPKPLTPQEINELLNDVTKPKKAKFSTKGMDNDITPSTDTPTGKEFPHGRIPPRKPSNLAEAGEGPSASDLLGFLPGVGKFAKLTKLLSTLPDATTVRNKALTKALQASIFSGMNPDSTYVR